MEKMFLCQLLEVCLCEFPILGSNIFIHELTHIKQDLYNEQHLFLFVFIPWGVKSVLLKIWQSVLLNNRDMSKVKKILFAYTVK